jgi:hypothetical protein
LNINNNHRINPTNPSNPDKIHLRARYSN